MLTYFFILTLYMATMGGGGTIQAVIQTSTEQLCLSMRRAVMTQLPDANGFASDCHPLLRPETPLPEVSSLSSRQEIP